MDNIVYIGIGSNQGDKYQNCLLAIEAISAHRNNQLLARSPCYLTEPWGNRVQEAFINLVIKIRTSLSPLELITFLQVVEKKLKREKKERWMSRTIDLDILFYNNETMHTPHLTIPHPLLHLRGFVLLPLHDLEPGLVHPVLNQTVSQMIKKLGDDTGIITRLEERF